MDWIETEDGSRTLMHEGYNETYHSKCGAWSESQSVFLRPFLERSPLSKNKNWRVLDVGFGLGYNWLSYVNSFLHRCTPLFDNPADNGDLSGNDLISLVSLELEEPILEVNLNPELLGSFPAHQDAFDLLREFKKNKECQSKNVQARMIMGHAKEGLRKLVQDGFVFDVILQDPFSPQKNPECWDQEFFDLVAKCCQKDTMLLTYSVARVVCENLQKAGFSTEKTPGFGTKREQLIAKYA